jgi:hypothetical protein
MQAGKEGLKRKIPGRNDFMEQRIRLFMLIMRKHCCAFV